MNCAEFQEKLPALMEGERDAQSQAHMQGCAACADLLSDLNAIADQAHSLPSNLEPPSRVWAALELQLREEGLIRDAKPDHRLFVLRPNRRWSPAAWLTPIAAAVVVAALMLLPAGTKKGTTNQPPTSVTTIAAPAPDPQDAEIMAEVEKNAPGMQAVYAENLRNINQYLADAEQSVKDDPNDDEAREYLLQASEQKAMLYEMALDRSLP